MPTKPSSTFVWAKNPNYTVGPFIGSSTKLSDPQGATEGFVPGDTIIAEYVNDPLSITGDWLSSWLDLGTPSADLDAHIVETDTDGASALAVLALGGTTSSDFPLFISKNTGDPSTCIQGTNDAGSVAIFQGSGAFATLSATASDASGQAISASHSAAGTAIAATAATGKAIVATSTSGNAVEATSTSGFAGFFNSLGNSAAVRGGSSSATAAAIEGINVVSTGIGVLGQSNAGTGVKGQSNLGIAIDGNATTGTAGRFTSTIGRAIIATNNSSGVQAIEARNSSVTGVGLFATTDNVLSTSAAKAIWGQSEGVGVGVFGQALSGGIGVSGNSSGGIGVSGVSTFESGVYGSSTNGVGISGHCVNGVAIEASSDTDISLVAISNHNLTAPFLIDPNSATPASIEEGNLYFQEVNKNLFFVHEPTGGGSPKAFAAWGTQKGFTEGYNFDIGGSIILPGNTGTLLTVGLTSPNEPRITGYIEISGYFRVTYSGAGVGMADWELWDTTSAVNIVTASITFSSGGLYSSIPFRRRYLVPAIGARGFELRVHNTSGSNVVTSESTISIKGVYDTAST